MWGNVSNLLKFQYRFYKKSNVNSKILGCNVSRTKNMIYKKQFSALYIELECPKATQIHKAIDDVIGLQI